MYKAGLIFLIGYLLTACAGLKMIHPNRPNEKGTLAYDYQTGKFVATHTCTMVGSNGNRVYATAKSEEEARKEVISKCQDQTLVSFCEISKMSCEKN